MEVDVCTLPSLALAFVAKGKGNDGMDFGAILAFLTIFSKSLQSRPRRDRDILFCSVSPARLTETERLAPEVNDGH